MEQAHQFVLIGSVLLIAGILAGVLSTRIGAPLLVAFLGLGMAVGPSGLGLTLRDPGTTYLIGCIALALILFDGGLHTRGRVFRLALAPATVLATLGALMTAAITGVGAMAFLHLDWRQGGLIGAIVSSTDAAAVFLLLHQRGSAISERLGATLETEAGINDPTGVFMTVTLVALLSGVAARSPADLGLFLLRQAALGLVIGVAGGTAMVQLVNRLNISAGLYPILVMAGALAIFGGTQMVDGSGYLAVYVAGILCGNLHLRSSQTITRFHEAMGWFAQLVLFIMLGLMVTWSRLLPTLPAALGISAVLALVARPVAVFLCLTPFQFRLQEQLFVAWVGLRGAVPIFMAMIPQFAGLPHSEIYFQVAFVVVLSSLLLQGWTVAPAAKWLHLDLPEEPEAAERLDLAIANESAREVAAWRVAAGSPALDRPFPALRLPTSARVIAVLRDDVVMDREKLEYLQPGDVVMALAPDEAIEPANRLFAERRREAAVLGHFAVDAATPMGTLVELYGLPAPDTDMGLDVGAFVRRRLHRSPVVGDRVQLGTVDLVVRRLDGDRIIEIGIVLEHEHVPFEELALGDRFRLLLKRWFRRG
ncbi:MAG TPA: potassium/proton antiporter [Stellaceae bacterium]|nr:potassium/proton antiporter [Stellaceae bacterium]